MAFEATESDENVLQKHVEFFDRNHDGVIYPWETFQVYVFEKGLIITLNLNEVFVGSGILLSSAASIFINITLSGKTRPGKKFPNLLFPIEIKNITMAKHGSDSDIYDTNGRFVSSKFEEIFNKFARTNPDSLTSDELNEFIKANREPKDYMGWLGGFLEWKILYHFAKDKNGLLKKDSVRAVFDGSLFEKLAQEKIDSSKKKYM